MLEQDLTELFEVQAAEDQPPVQASIAAAAHHGRTRLRRRRTALATAPLLAAAAGLTIAMGGTLLTPAPAPVPPAQSQSHQLPSLYLWPRWLPPGLTAIFGSVYPQYQENLQLIKGNSSTGSIATFSGHCVLSPPKLSCGRNFWTRAQNASPPSVLRPLHGRAGTINGFPAYWSGSGYLLLEWARDRWVIVGLPTQADDLRVARHLSAHVPPIRYPFQLTASWPDVGVQSVGFKYAHGRAVASGITLAWAADLAPRVAAPFRNIVQADVGPAGSTPGCIRSGAHEVINGYHVDISWTDRHGSDPIQDVCVRNADGLQVWTHSYGKHLFASAPEVFAHLRLFGSNPANYPVTPFR